MQRKLWIGLVLLAVGAAGCNRSGTGGGTSSGAVGGAAARVNGKEISRSEVENYFKVRTAEMTEQPTGDAARIAKLEILRQLIEAEIMSQKADELKLKPTDAEVDAQMKGLRGGATDEVFANMLAGRGISEAELRRQISQNLMMEKVVEDQVSSRIQVSDEEITKFYEENKSGFNVTEPLFRIGLMAVTGDPTSPVNNMQNDKALNEEQAIRKIQMLESRVRAGEDFQALARDYSEDPQTAQQGGDLGFQPSAMLDRFGTAFKDTVLKMKVGDMTPVIRAENSYLLFKLLGRREPGQYDLTDAEVKQGIRAELQSRKQQLLTAAFLEKLHNDARVENILANEVLASFQTAN
ncbi:MAG: SurA N-terminal domain-containing protein [Acidobacteria bacterium]|nr:SurA N-terminal domain-containing protein [Acidobacteriota bacterium]